MSGLVFANLAATAAILFILLFRKIFIEKVYPKVFVLLWMLVVLRLLLPFEFSSGISLYSFEEEKQSALPETEFVYEEETLPEKIPQRPENNFSEKTDVQKARISPEKILFSVWISGSVLTGCFFAAKHFYLVKKLLKNSVPFEEVPEGYKTENIRFYKSKTAASPLSCGILKPVIILPEDMSEEQLPFVLLHEQTHIKDRDSALKILALFALAINWFNPFVWFMVKMLERDIERYCDERVLKKLGGKNALYYANTILDFAERESLSLNYFSAASLCERVTSIMKNKNKKKNLPAVLAVFAAIILAMTACGTVPKETETKTEAENLGNLLQQIEDETLASHIYVDIETGDLFPVIPYNNALFYPFDAEEIKKVVITDLGIPADSSFEINCIKTRDNSICANRYDILLNAGLNIRQENDTLIISVDKPLGYLDEDFGIDIFADLEKIEIVSEVQPINYFNVPSVVESSGNIDFSDIPYTADDSEYSGRTAGELAEKIGYMTFEEITAAGYYPCWMQPGTYIIYDENGVPTITEGGELLPEDLVGRPEFEGEGAFFSPVEVDDPFMLIQPGTKAEYDHYGFIQNIYFLWPDGSYNLSPPVSESNEVQQEGVVAFYWPCDARTVSANAKTRPGHKGIDIATGHGANVYASAGGKIVFAGESDEGLGKYIIIAHDYGYTTIYAHCSELYVTTGQIVECGEIIALTGSTRNSTGPHLHFELLYNEVQLDPEYSLQP